MLLEWRAAAAPCLCSFPGELRGLCWEPVLTPLLPLVQVVQSGGKNIELAVMRRDQPLKVRPWLGFSLSPVSLVLSLLTCVNFQPPVLRSVLANAAELCVRAWCWVCCGTCVHTSATELPELGWVKSKPPLLLSLGSPVFLF